MARVVENRMFVIKKRERSLQELGRCVGALEKLKSKGEASAFVASGGKSNRFDSTPFIVSR